jgi:glycosyltransferase involved in cell wall biosynthesis
MKIALFTLGFIPEIGGAEIAVFNLAKELTKAGNQVYVVHPRRPFSKQNKYNFNFKVINWPHLGLQKIHERLNDLYLEILFIILQKVYRFNVINIHKAYLGYPMAKVKRFISAKVIITTHGGDIQTNRELNYGRILDTKWYKRVKYACLMADAHVAISSNTKQILSSFGVPNSKIFRIPNGVDESRFSVYPNSSDELYSLSSKDLVILATGRCMPIKGFNTIIKAAAIIKEHIPNFKLVIVGRWLEKLDPLICSEKVDSIVVRIPQQEVDLNGGNILVPNNQLLELYNRADIFVSSSYIEGFSLGIVEAMFSGIPLVLSKCPGNEDVLNADGLGGFYFPPGDEQSLARRIKELSLSSELREQFSKYNRQFASHHYTWRIVAKQYSEAFSKIS